MQDLLTAAIEIVTVSFAILLILDFVTGLARLSAHSGVQPSLTAQSEAEIAPEIARDQQPDPQHAATLEWLEQHVPAPQINAIELPNVIEIARARQQRTPVVEVTVQPRLELTALGIRDLKKLASAAKIRNYNVMVKAELIARLTDLNHQAA